MKRLLLGILSLCLAHTAWAMRGANFVQSAKVAWGSSAAAESLRQLRETGADTVALVPFMQQSRPDSCDLAWSQHYDMPRIQAAIRQAHAAGLRVMLKPQVLVPGSWAGEVAARDVGCWFAAYKAAVVPLAALAQAEGVERFVVGTELKQMEKHAAWRDVIAVVRGVYSGSIGYVFHDRDDAPQFAALADLDAIGLSLYPRLGTMVAEAFRATAWQRRALRLWAKSMSKPVWIAEVGVPSRVGAGETPWQWGDRAVNLQPDMHYQAEALAYWLDALSGDWNEGVLIWNWMSAPEAGGILDADFTPQNKPARQVLHCIWQGGSMKECTL